jgi:hypothetical protein
MSICPVLTLARYVDLTYLNSMSIEHTLSPVQRKALESAYPTQAEAARALQCSLRTYARVLKGQCKRGKTVLLAKVHADALLSRQFDESGRPLPATTQPDRQEA